MARLCAECAEPADFVVIGLGRWDGDELIGAETIWLCRAHMETHVPSWVKTIDDAYGEHRPQ